jgi:MerR family redox-sensitive transcriptional activator SoxR
MHVFSIGEIAERVGVAPSAIRYYERIGLLPPSRRVNGKRRYDEGIVRKLNLIQMAQHAGLRIAEIQTLLHDFPVNTPPSERWRGLATHKIDELDTTIARLYAMKALLAQTLACSCDTLEGCVSAKSNAQTGKNSVESFCGLP